MKDTQKAIPITMNKQAADRISSLTAELEAVKAREQRMIDSYEENRIAILESYRNLKAERDEFKSMYEGLCK